MGYASETEYFQDLAQDLLRNQLAEGLSLSTLEIKQDLAYAVQLLEQTRNIGYIVLPLTQYQSAVSNLISAEAIKQYYDTHTSQFVFPEQVALDYIQLSVEGLMSKISVTDQDLKTFYEQNPALFSKPEQVHARHILISALHKENQNAKEKAEAVFAKIKAGEDFGTLAKSLSDDPESAKEGGDLKWFGRGIMVPAFDEAVFGLKKAGDIIGPVHTDYGYHIIQLIDRKDAEKRSFEDSKALITEHYRKTKAEALFASTKAQWEKLMREHPSDLKPIADALGLTVETTALFGRQAKNDTDTGIITHSEVRKAAFSGQVMVNGKNSELLALNEGSEVPDKYWVMIHLNQHQPAKQQTLEEATPAIRTKLIEKQAMEKAKEVADVLVLNLKESAASEQNAETQKILSELSNQHQLKWITRNNLTRENQELDLPIIMNAFKLAGPNPKTGKLNATAFALPNGDCVALTVTKVTLGDVEKLDRGTKAALQKKISAMNHQIEYDLYVRDILSKAKVKFFEMPNEVE
jgi:peptidyl-prolyl cis-trans isomerase D